MHSQTISIFRKLGTDETTGIIANKVKLLIQQTKISIIAHLNFPMKLKK